MSRISRRVTPVLFAGSDDTEKRFWEFFTANIRNPNTRMAYLMAAYRFADWCEARGLTLDRVEPMLVAAYIEQLTKTCAPATVKQHLAAIRVLFDWLVVGQVVPFNPASSVRGPETRRENRQDAGADGRRGPCPVGQYQHGQAGRSARPLPDRPDGIQLRTRECGRVAMRVADYYTQGKRSFFRLHEKGGKYLVVPAHHVGQAYVDEYIEAAAIGDDRQGPLFRSSGQGRKQDVLLRSPMTRQTALKMIKRRVSDTGLPDEITNHSFRGTGITEYLRNGGDLEIAARIAGHESTRTTQLYNRTHEELSLDEIERIHI